MIKLLLKKGTNTVLNHDVQLSKNVTFDKQLRKELGSLGVQWLQDQFFIENMEYERSFIQKGKYRNYYEGYSSLSYPYYSDSDSRYESATETYATSGSVRTPGFGEKFDSKKFKNRVLYIYVIYIPTDFANYKKQKLDLVLNFNIDVQLYGGYDEVYSNIEYLGSEWFHNSGNITRRYNARDLGRVYITYTREVEQNSVDKQTEKRVTGFSLEWHFENGKGNMVGVKPDKKFLGWSTRNFIQFINLFYHAVTADNII